MLSCFKSKMRITQMFGNNFKVGGVSYYGQYGLPGHNGLDVVPVGKEDSIYNFFGGLILKIEYNQTYGNRIVIWNKEKQLLEYHNHMDFVNPKLGVNKIIYEKTYLGKMGNTGKSMGKHDHVAFRETDEKGYVKDHDDKYRGWKDPLKYIM